MAFIQTATLVIITVNLIMEIANAVGYHRRINQMEERIEALEAMVGSSH